MDVGRLISSQKIDMNYNKANKREIATLKNHCNAALENKYECLRPLDECEFFEIFSGIDEMHECISKFLNKKEYVIGDSNIAVVTGPKVKSTICDTEKGIPLRNEYTIHFCGMIPLRDMICVNGEIEVNREESGAYIYLYDGATYIINKKVYNSPAHCLLSMHPLDRIGYVYKEKKVWLSDIFILDLYKNLTIYSTEERDPVFGYPLDVLDIYDRSAALNDSNDVKRLIDLADYQLIQGSDIASKASCFIKYGGYRYTLIEYSILKCNEEMHPIIVHQYRQIILHLSSYTFIRPPHLFAKVIGFDKSFPGIYAILDGIGYHYPLSDFCNYKVKNTHDIDMYLVYIFITNDDSDRFFEYINRVNFIKKLGKRSNTGNKIVKWLIDKKAKSIIRRLADDKILETGYKYKCFLMVEEIDMFGEDVNRDILVNYLGDTINNYLIRSFYYILKKNPDILESCKSKLCAEGGSILHMLDKDGCYEMMIIVIKINESLLKSTDDKGRTPLILYAERGLSRHVGYIMANCNINAEFADNLGETFVHKICSGGHSDLLQMVIRKNMGLINMKNNNMETPAILASKNGHEDTFYILKGLCADLDAVDRYGNSAYHYICLNKICPGMFIINKKNNFGFFPSDYAKISKRYYNFSETI